MVGMKRGATERDTECIKSAILDRSGQKQYPMLSMYCCVASKRYFAQMCCIRESCCRKVARDTQLYVEHYKKVVQKLS